MTRYFILALALVLTTALLSSCGDDDAPPSGSDAATVDAGGARDAGADSGPDPMDAGEAIDASSDAGSGDAAASDAGTDAGGPEPCTMAGARRTIPCGACGMQAQQCTAGFWADDGICFGEGECVPSTIDRMTNTFCAEFQRLCSMACTWGPFTRATPDGICEIGSTRIDLDDCATLPGRQQTCSGTCEWEDSSACSDACGGWPRTTPATSAEVCIPAGDFNMGTDDPLGDISAGERPMHLVTMPAYYIDVYPITNDRLRACVDAGVCGTPASGAGTTSYRDPTRGDYPVQGFRDRGSFPLAAEQFCTWDGGRILPTEAMWEKAARGPLPSTRLWIWADTWDCSIPVGTCPGSDPTAMLCPFAVTSLPASRSAYGTFLQTLGVWEITSDGPTRTYTSSPVVDPSTVPSGATRLVRGSPWTADPWNQRITVRGAGDPTNPYTGARCARRVPPPPP